MKQDKIYRKKISPNNRSLRTFVIAGIFFSLGMFQVLYLSKAMLKSPTRIDTNSSNNKGQATSEAYNLTPPPPTE